MYTSMKTISLDHPVRVSVKDGECYHDSAAIMIANGFPSFVHGKGPDVIYPWENVKHVLRVADEVDTATTTEMGLLQAEVERSKQDAMRLGTLLTSTVAKVSFALGRAAPDSRDHDTAVDLARDIDKLRDELENAKRGWRVEHEIAENFKRDLGQAFSEVEQSKRMHLETLAKMRGALTKALGQQLAGERDFDGLCKCAAAIREEWSALRAIGFNKPGVDLDRLAQALGIGDEWDAEFHTLLKHARRVASLHEEDQRSITSLIEQRDVLKRHLEELRADMRKPAVPQPKQVEPGGPIWVRVVDTTSKHFGLAGRLEGISFRGNDEVWSVDLGGISPVHRQANMFAVVGTGRQGIPEEAKSEPHNHGVLSQTLDQKAKSFHENNPPDTEHQPQYHGNGESLRAVATAAGANDCSVFVDDGQVTLVVGNLRHGKTLQHVANVVFDLVPILDTKTYVVRTAGPIGERREVRSTPESRSRTPRP